MGCKYKVTHDYNYYCEKLSLKCVRKNQKVSFRTSKGNFDVLLFGENHPLTVTNFISNVEKNFYKDIKFYKIINYPQVKVIHSGIKPENNFEKKDIQNREKYYSNIPLEIKLRNKIEPVYKKQIKNLTEVENIKNVFKKGSLAMVKEGANNSSSSEFFFVTNKFPELDGRYSVFGKVEKGFEVLEKIEKKDLLYEILISN